MRMVKRIVTLCVSGLIMACSLGATVLPVKAEINRASAKSLKVLAIGNSFSVDALQHLYQIAEDCGADEVVIGNLYIGGCSLAKHWDNAKNNKAEYQFQKNKSGIWEISNNATMFAGIKNEDWDVITIQQVSGDSGVSSTYNSDITNLVSYINENKTNANAKVGWHMTWAYQTGSNHSDFPKYNNDQITMYNAIVNAAKSNIVTNESIDIIIPAGTAIQNVRTSYIGDSLTRDGYHLSLNLGRYIAGLTWLKAITGWSIDDITYVPNSSEIPTDYLPIIKEAVNNAVEKPFEITQSSFTDKPKIDFNRYNLLDWQPQGLAYWNSGNGAYNAEPILNAGANNSKFFVSSAKRFTKDDIPIGSLIVIDSGYQYRPDGWAPEGADSPGRPDNVSTEIIIVDEQWWESYEYRAFNVSFVAGNTDITDKVAETASHFRIYLPKSDEKTIIDFSVGEVKGVITDNTITLDLPFGTKISALSPVIKVSEKATVSPLSGSVQDFTAPVEYTVTAEDGTVQVYTVTVNVDDSSLGDLNGDSKITVTDIVNLRGLIMGSEKPSDYQFAAGDINKDGELTVSDIVALRAIIMNSEAS